jgi:Holliday junction resolvasome RuvABC endonuclease subunit
MKILTLDLAKQTGWAAISDGGKITSGHVTFTEETFPELALAFWTWINARIIEHKPEFVAYEAPVVKHPHATKILVGLSWLTILACKIHDIPCEPVTNTKVKVHFVGRVYGKKEKPYPGIEEAKKRGWSPRSTDEADALAILSYVLHQSCCDGPRATPARRDPKPKRRAGRGRRPSKA